MGRRPVVIYTFLYFLLFVVLDGKREVMAAILFLERGARNAKIVAAYLANVYTTVIH